MRRTRPYANSMEGKCGVEVRRSCAAKRKGQHRGLELTEKQNGRRERVWRSGKKRFVRRQGRERRMVQKHAEFPSCGESFHGAAVITVAVRVSVPQLHRLVFPGGRAARHGGSALCTARQNDIGLDRWVASAIEYFSSMDASNRAHRSPREQVLVLAPSCSSCERCRSNRRPPHIIRDSLGFCSD